MGPVAEWEHNFLQIVLLIPIPCICMKSFHVHDSHMHVVWLHMLDTSNASLWPQSNSYVEVNHMERIHHSIVPQYSPVKECPPAKSTYPGKHSIVVVSPLILLVRAVGPAPPSLPGILKVPRTICYKKISGQM